MKTIFYDSVAEKEDQQLIEEALGGSQTALSHLLKRHYNFIYNVALRFVLNPQDAEDITQEVIIKAMTKLSQFKQESEFSTWLYRIVFNHFLNSQKRKLEKAHSTFDEYAESLDSVPFEELDEEERISLKEQVEDAKIGCMTGMLLCLDRQQRMVFILGELFELDSQLGASLLDISPVNFRKVLSRARTDLYHFMNQKCGLINKSNPCRCPKKTKGFMKAGWVNENDLKFNNHFLHKLKKVSAEKSQAYDSLMDEAYGALFKDHPFYDKDRVPEIMEELTKDLRFTSIFNFK